MGILVAFSLDAWWTGRAERADEQVILQGLHDEFTTNRSAPQDDIQRHRNNILSAHELLSFTGATAALFEPGRVDMLIFRLLETPT